MMVTVVVVVMVTMVVVMVIRLGIIVDSRLWAMVCGLCVVIVL